MLLGVGVLCGILRSSLLASWPSGIAPRRTKALGQYCDIVPTLIDLAGGEPRGQGSSCTPKAFELYRIEDDFHETKDLAATPETAERVDSMRTDLLTFMKQLGDPIYDPQVDAPAIRRMKRDKRKRQRP